MEHGKIVARKRCAFGSAAFKQGEQGRYQMEDARHALISHGDGKPRVLVHAECLREYFEVIPA
ncbi:hypothetical protein [Burkholderia sp. Ac-20365]|uniref:hypothetical protein n=1 Tax=Burkholderia sp. Ac-20365 TaxID=2703897 RepID=UPI00197B2DF6|nr:hypothetical protein [Burkholderia sp. Ac-20365]MBN3760892.1 hypothetical protein [Burkholderia sp. Ac-20365]